MNIPQLVRDRDEALLSLDRQKIEAYARKYGVKLPQDELVFWAAVRKAILAITSAPETSKVEAREWLITNGFRPGLFQRKGTDLPPKA